MRSHQNNQFLGSVMVSQRLAENQRSFGVAVGCGQRHKSFVCFEQTHTYIFLNKGAPVFFPSLLPATQYTYLDIHRGLTARYII